MNLTAKRHDLIGIHIYDRSEMILPNELGMVQVRHPETGAAFYLDASEKAFRALYEDQHKENLDKYNATFKKYGAASLCVSTEDDYIKALIEMFRKR